MWIFDEFIEPSGQAPFSAWIQALEPEPRAFVDSRLLSMARMERWPEKWASKYRGTERLIEIRVTFQKVQYRPLGIYSPWERRHFILLAGAVEKGKIKPTDIEIALEREARTQEDAKYVRRYQHD